MLQTLSNTGSRHIARSDDTFMKEPIVIGTKVFVRDIVEVWRSGVAPESIPAQLFDLVSVTQVFDAIGFYLDNQVEIDDHNCLVSAKADRECTCTTTIESPEG